MEFFFLIIGKNLEKQIFNTGPIVQDLNWLDFPSPSPKG